MNLSLSDQVCENKNKIRVAKVIRLHAIQQLKSEFSGLTDFHVIYLVRDPRGMASSRFGLKGNGWTETDKRHKLGNICSRYKENYEFLKSENSNWIRDKVTVLRYEDFSLNPELYVDSIFERVGIKTGIDRVKLELHKLSEARKKKRRKKRSALQAVTLKEHKFTTVRNSSDVVFAWRDKLDWDTVNHVQLGCSKEVMDWYGYQFFSEDNFSNNVRPIVDGWTF